MAEERNPRLKELILEAVDNQIRDGDPPETRETLDRLIAEGYTDEEARELIACVLADEIFTLLRDKQPEDRARFTAALQKLPELPSEDQD